MIGAPAYACPNPGSRQHAQCTFFTARNESSRVVPPTVSKTMSKPSELVCSATKSGAVHAFIASEPASVQEGAEYRDGQFRTKFSGTSGWYERDPKKALALDLQLFRRPSGVLNGGATTLPLSQPEWGV